MLNAISWCHIQAGYTSVQLALEQKHEATVEVLLEAIVAAGMDIDARYESRREQGQTLLMRASALGLTSTAAKLLALGADIAAKNTAGYTSVELAVEQKHEATVEVLLEAIVAAGMDIDARYESRREQGQTLLMRASALGLTSTAAKLLALGADIAAKDANGKGVFDHTKEIKDEEKRAAVLALMAEYSVLCAVATGKADLVAAAVAKGCTVNETDQVDRYACMCMFVLFVAVFMYTYIERERVFFSLFQFIFPLFPHTQTHAHSYAGGELVPPHCRRQRKQ